MKKILVIIGLFICVRGEAQFATSGSNRTGNSVTAGSSFTTTYISSLAVGRLAVFRYASDNLSNAADGDKGDVTSITDDAGNVYTKAAEFSNTQSAAAGGATIGIWYCVITNAVTSANIITVQFGGSVTAKAWSINGFTFSAGSTISVFTPFTTAANDATTVQSASTGTLPSKEYLIFRISAAETSSTFVSAATGGWTSLGWTGTSGGGSASNMGLFTEMKIATTTSETSTPTGSASADNATIVIAFYAVAVGGGNPRRVTIISKNNTKPSSIVTP